LLRGIAPLQEHLVKLFLAAAFFVLCGNSVAWCEETDDTIKKGIEATQQIQGSGSGGVGPHDPAPKSVDTTTNPHTGYNPSGTWPSGSKHPDRSDKN
jgi:hypothetical protein